MSSEEDEEDVYDVERILAEKVDDLGEHVYLVKWDGYPDEECTWEPAEHFTDPDALRQWAAQKARGDTLDAYDVQRIQDQMDAFNARHDEQADSEVEGDDRGPQASSMDLDEIQERPRKRLKLVSYLTAGIISLDQRCGCPMLLSWLKMVLRALSKPQVRKGDPCLQLTSNHTRVQLAQSRQLLRSIDLPTKPPQYRNELFLRFMRRQ